MQPQPILNFDDITLGKHGGNANSIAANEVARKTRSEKRERILQLARDAGTVGVTLYEIQAATGYLTPTISSQLARMKAAGQLVALKQTRDSRHGTVCAVHVLPEYADDADVEPTPAS